MSAPATVVVLMLALCAPTTHAIGERTPLERECETVTSLALLAAAVDEESGGMSDALLVDVCREFGELPTDDPVVDVAVVRGLLVAGAALVDRMASRHPGEQVAVAKACTAFASHFGRSDDALGALRVSWASRAVRVECGAGSVRLARDALVLAEQLADARELADRLVESGALSSDDRTIEEELRQAGDMLLSQRWLVEDAGPTSRADADRVRELLERVGVSSQASAIALGNVLERLDKLAGDESPDPLALRSALDAVASVRRNLDPAGSEAFGAELEARLVPLVVRITPSDELFDWRNDTYTRLLDEWQRVRDGRVTAEPADGATSMRVLGPEGLLPLPSPAALGFDGPRVLPGLTYVLTLGGAGRPVVVVETERGRQLDVVVPAVVPADGIVVHRASDRDSARLLRVRPWTRLEWLEFMQRVLTNVTRNGPAVELFARFRHGEPTQQQIEACGEPTSRAAVLESFRSDPSAGETVAIDAGHLGLMRAIRVRREVYLDSLHLPDEDDAEWLLGLIRALEPSAVPGRSVLLTQQALDPDRSDAVVDPALADGTSVVDSVTCDVLVVVRG